MSKRDYYDVLGIKKGASSDEIKKSYRKLAKEHHPDKGGNGEMFKEISEAYNNIGDENKRQEYDQMRNNPFGGDPFDVFNSFFNRRKPVVKGRDLNMNINVSVEDIFFSEHKKIKYNCKECYGYSYSYICEHDRSKYHCKECKGSSICPHNRVKYYCKDCGGTQICLHNRRKTRCYECGGGSICEHNKRKWQCKECEPELRLINLQRNHIRKCFNISNLEKKNPSIEYLGCDIKYFMEYFQKKMDLFNKFSEIEMTWDNIHIDHIKPVSSFKIDDEDEFLNCCHYTNMQPLLCQINLNKSDKWTEKNEEFWLNNIQGKEYIDLYLP